MVPTPQEISRNAKTRLGFARVIVKRIDDETRRAIAVAAEAIEADGWEANRRALAREVRRVDADGCPDS
jgi:hypothetical protein